MKDKVTAYFKTDRGFASGKVLYASLPGRSTAFVNALNRMTETPANIEKLHYQLGKVAGLTERHVGILLRQEVEVDVEDIDLKVFKIVGQGKVGSGDSDVLKLEKPTFADGAAGNRERQAFVKEKGIEAASKKTVDLDTAIDAWWEENKEVLQAEHLKNEVVKQFEAAPEPEKKAVKLFDRFPFLTQDECPQVFKTLVGELGATYRKYKEAHTHLFEKPTFAERLEVAKAVVTPFEENKAIWAELEHYQTKGECLGKHTLVADYLRKEEIKAMNGEQLANLKKNLITNINRNKKAMEGLEGKKADNKAALINTQEEELRFVEVELKSR